MSDFTAIAAVTGTLKSLLEQELPGVTIDEKSAPPSVTSTTAMIGLYLYRVEPNPFGANLDWEPTGANQLAAPPFALNLHYLVTPYGPDEVEIQKMLGEVIRTFHEHAVVRRGDPLLPPALAAITEELRILPRVLPLNDMLELWKGFEKVPFRLSMTYEVSTIVIDSRLVRAVQRVQERVIDLSTMR
jgi:hypothetical protein